MVLGQKRRKGKGDKPQQSRDDVDSPASSKTSSKNLPIYVGPPDDVLEGGWPDGWIKRVYKRGGGGGGSIKTAGTTDKYWYTPSKSYKLRSMVQVKKFVKALERFDGDEELAYKNFNK